MPDGKLGTKESACDNDYSAFYQETGAGRWSYCYCFDFSIVVIIVVGTMTTRGLVLENVFVNLIAQHFIRIFSFPFPESSNFHIGHFHGQIPFEHLKLLIGCSLTSNKTHISQKIYQHASAKFQICSTICLP